MGMKQGVRLNEPMMFLPPRDSGSVAWDIGDGFSWGSLLCNGLGKRSEVSSNPGRWV